MTSLERRSLFALLFLHLIGWVFIPLLTNTCLPLDSIEAIYWGHEWQWGYDKHPPLSAWAAEGFAVMFGDAGIYLVSQLCVILGAYGMWLVGRFFGLSVKQRVMGILLMETIVFYQYTTPEFNVNIMQLPFWSLGWYWGLLAAESGKYRHWIGLGVCVAAGALGKYLAVLMLPPLFAAYWQRGQLKSVLGHPGIYLAGIVSILLFLPHLLWMRAHDWQTITYGLERTADEETVGFFKAHFINPLIYLLSQLGILAPALLIARWGGGPAVKGDDKGLTGLAWGSLGVVFLLSVVMGWKPVTMWSVPFCLGIGMWAAARFSSAINLRKIVTGSLGVGVLALMAQVVVYGFGPVTREKAHKANYDGPGIAKAVEAIWADEVGGELDIVIGDRFPAGIVSWYGESRPSVMVMGDENLSSPAASNELVREKGALVIWRKSRDSESAAVKQVEEILPRAVTEFPEMELLDDLVVQYPRRSDGQAIRFGIGIVRPHE